MANTIVSKVNGRARSYGVCMRLEKKSADKRGSSGRTTRTKMRARTANVAVQIPVFTANMMRRCKMCAVLGGQHFLNNMTHGYWALTLQIHWRPAVGAVRMSWQLRSGHPPRHQEQDSKWRYSIRPMLRLFVQNIGEYLL